MCFNNILFEHTETRMNKKIKNPETDHLFQAILTLKNLDECYAFFEDVCTVNELQSIAQRFEVAAMLCCARKTHILKLHRKQVHLLRQSAV